jgi:uncharacterized protein
VTFEPESWIILLVVACVAALINGAAGFGFALVAVIGFSFVLDPKIGIVVLSVVTPLMNALHVRRQWEHRGVTPRLRPVLITGVIGSITGTQLLILLPSWGLAILLGLFTLWYVGSSMKKGPMLLSKSRERYVAPAVGFVGGISNGTIGAAGPVLGSYLLAIGLTGREWIFAINLLFVTMSMVRIGMLGIAGQYTVAIVLLGLSLILPAFLLQRVGVMIGARMSREAFQRIVMVVLLVASLNLIWRGISQAIQAL